MIAYAKGIMQNKKATEKWQLINKCILNTTKNLEKKYRINGHTATSTAITWLLSKRPYSKSPISAIYVQ